MNDRFKFRVWDKDAKEYLTLYEEDEKTGMHCHWIGWDNTGVYQYDRDVERDIVFVTDISQSVELEQFTGLNDKNGRLIYEGDIVKETSFDEESCLGREFVETSVVCFGGGDYPCSFTLKNERFYRGYALLNYGINRLELEVIGNIHENPELLEKQR